MRSKREEIERISYHTILCGSERAQLFLFHSLIRWRFVRRHKMEGVNRNITFLSSCDPRTFNHWLYHQEKEFYLCFAIISTWNSERIEILSSMERKSLTKRGSSEGLNRHLICLCLRHSLAHSLLFSSEQEECGFNKLMKFLHKKKRLVKIQESVFVSSSKSASSLFSHSSLLFIFNLLPNVILCLVSLMHHIDYVERTHKH